MKQLIPWAGALLPLTFLAGCQQPVEQRKPNIIFILADDMGYGDLSLLNRESKIQTQHIDRLGREGIVFTDAHSSSSVSTPTRYGILTGRYNWRSTLKSGVLGGYSKALIPSDRRTLATVLSEQGYHTACIGKWHLGWNWANIEAGNDRVDFSQPIQQGPTTLGFDYFYGISGSLDMAPYVYVENDRPTSLPDRFTSNSGMKFWREGPTGADFDHEQTLPNFINRAVDYIHQQADGDQPFFLYLPLPAPHTPILPIAEYQGKSGIGPYGDFVMMVDDMVGKIMEALEESGISDNTLLLFTADNGCSLAADIAALEQQGHHPSYHFRGQKADLYDGGHRIPCMLRWRDKVKPHTINQTICLTDFFATFADIAGYSLKDNEAEDSFSLLPLMEETKETTIVREATVHHSIDGDFTIRKGQWKLLLSPGSGGWSFPTNNHADIASFPPVQLYDLTNDPSETENLWQEHPAVVEELKALLISYIRNGRSRPGAPQQNDGPEHWRQLDWME